MARAHCARLHQDKSGRFVASNKMRCRPEIGVYRHLGMAVLASSKPRVVILPGNGCDDLVGANWYLWMAERLRAEGRFSEVVARTMPDPHMAKRKVWLPFIVGALTADEHTVLVGHSSGAVAAMRFLEDYPARGAVLVSACHTDLGDAGERASGYYPPSGGPWQWEKMRSNAGASGGNIAVLHSDNDPFIPLHEAQHVASCLEVPLRVVPGRSHFFKPCEELIEAVYHVAFPSGQGELPDVDS